MEDENWININVVVADRPYRLKIKVDEEEMVRKAAKIINTKVKEFQQVFNSKDKQDYLAMIAIQNTVETLKGDGSICENGDNEIAGSLEEIEELLSEHLANSKSI